MKPALHLVQGELARQQALKAAGKFAETAGDMMRRGGAHEALTVLTEEVGEVARVLNDRGTCLHLRDELVQVAAVAIDAIDGLDYAIVSKASAI